jgi:pantothenate kinase
MTTPTLPSGCLERALALLASGQRRILGIAAPPGAGKSTLALALQRTLGAQAQVVPMDGYHLANSELQRLGRSQRKGAADTFDAAGYLNLLKRIKAQQADETIYAPEYRREVEEGIAGAIAIAASTALIITEGNYLLMEHGPWGALKSVMDEVWYLDIDSEVRQKRLVERHMRFGRSEQAARDWVHQTDEPNALQIEGTRHRADWVVTYA